MQAWVLDTDREFEWRRTDVPMPNVGPDEVLVRLEAAALNHRDLNMKPYLQKLYADRPEQQQPPYVLASDGAGVIEEVGAQVRGWQPGDEVLINTGVYCGQCPHCLTGEHARCVQADVLGGPGVDGTLAEYIAVPARLLVRKPAHLTMSETAALPMALGTAWRALVTRAELRPGETVLIQGIGGGVALMALQLAVALGARVIVTSSSADKIRQALAIGAEAGINYRTEDVYERVMELTDGTGVDAVIDGGGASAMPGAVRAVRDLGRVVTFSMMGAERAFELPIYHLIVRQVSVLGTAMNTHGELLDAVRFVERTQLKPVISAVYPFAQTLAAAEYLERGEQFGKVVVEI